MVVRQIGWIEPRQPLCAVADTVESDRMAIEMAIVAPYCTSLVPDKSDTAGAISAEAAAAEQLLARMLPGTADFHPGLPGQCMVAVLSSHMRCS